MVLDLKLRKGYLGGTDLVAISGLSKYRQPGDVWIDKVKGSTFTGNDATQMGQDLEPVVAMRYQRRAQERGEQVVLAEMSEPVFHPEYPFIAANPDRIFTNRKRIFEAKTASEDQLYRADSEWGEDGERNKVPMGYYGQVNHYTGMMNFDDGVLSCLFLGRSRTQRDYPIDFDKALYDLLISNGVAFWHTYIEPKVQPPIELFSPDMVMKAISDSAMKHGGAKGVLVEADDLLLSWANTYKGLSDKIDELEGPKKMLAGKIAGWISSHKGTKVVHPLGSFTYQQPEPKPDYQEFCAEQAWKDLIQGLAARVPDGVASDLLDLATKIQAKYTKTITPEPSTPRLTTRWK